MASDPLLPWQHVALWLGVAFIAVGPWYIFFSHPVADSSWLSLAGWVVNTVFYLGLLVLLLSKRSRLRGSPWLSTAAIIAAVSALQAYFAQFYYGIALTPNAFNQKLTKFDAAYYTVSTATTAGVTSLAAASLTARIVVIVHVVSSLFIVVAALGIAFERLLSALQSDPVVSTGPETQATQVTQTIPADTPPTQSSSQPRQLAAVVLGTIPVVVGVLAVLRRLRKVEVLIRGRSAP